MVGRNISGISDGFRARIPQKLVLGLQTVDGFGTLTGLDQHEDYSRRCVLLGGNADWARQALARQRPHGQANQGRYKQL